MYVTCQPLFETDRRPVCGRVYDDARRWTICPHPPLDQAPPSKEEELAEFGAFLDRLRDVGDDAAVRFHEKRAVPVAESA